MQFFSKAEQSARWRTTQDGERWKCMGNSRDHENLAIAAVWVMAKLSGNGTSLHAYGHLTGAVICVLPRLDGGYTRRKMLVGDVQHQIVAALHPVAPTYGCCLRG